MPKPRTYKLEETGYDPVVHVGDEGEMEQKIHQAIQKSFEFGDHTPIGVFYQNEFIPTYEGRLGSRMPSYKTNPPALQEIAPRWCSSCEHPQAARGAQGNPVEQPLGPSPHNFVRRTRRLSCHQNERGSRNHEPRQDRGCSKCIHKILS